MYATGTFAKRRHHGKKQRTACGSPAMVAIAAVLRPLSENCTHIPLLYPSDAALRSDRKRTTTKLEERWRLTKTSFSRVCVQNPAGKEENADNQNNASLSKCRLICASSQRRLKFQKNDAEQPQITSAAP